MAIDIPRFSQDELGLQDYSRVISDAFSRGMDNYLKSKYSPDLLANQVERGRIENRYLPREKEANIGLTGAQTGLIGKQIGGYDRRLESELLNDEANRALTGASTRSTDARTKYQTDINKFNLPNNLLDVLQKGIRTWYLPQQSSADLASSAESTRARRLGNEAIEREVPLEQERLQQELDRIDRLKMLQKSNKDYFLNPNLAVNKELASNLPAQSGIWNSIKHLFNPSAAEVLPGLTQRQLMNQLTAGALGVSASPEQMARDMVGGQRVSDAYQDERENKNFQRSLSQMDELDRRKSQEDAGREVYSMASKLGFSEDDVRGLLKLYGNDYKKVYKILLDMYQSARGE